MKVHHKFNQTISLNDELFMKEALEEAKKSFALNEVPVGAVIVFEGKIIARAHNQVESLQDACAHAELLCIKQASQVLKNWRLLDCTLYSTLEPCAMCAGAILSSRITTLVWAAKDIRQGADGSFVHLLSLSHPIHEVEVRSGILESESAILLKTFFRDKREEKSKYKNRLLV